MIDANKIMKKMVKEVLLSCDKYKWTVQGLGMLRTYLTNDRTLRLHIWNKELKYFNVSEIHTHPWSFNSYQISGRIINAKYDLMAINTINCPYDNPEDKTRLMNMQMISCGENGDIVGTPTMLALKRNMESMTIGSYYQDAEEIHRSDADDGTVTLIERFFKEDTEHALVFYPAGENLVSAKPRPATEEEVSKTVALALHNWRTF